MAIKSIFYFQKNKKDFAKLHSDYTVTFLEALGQIEYLFAASLVNLYNSNPVTVESSSLNILVRENGYFLTNHYFESQNYKYSTSMVMQLPNFDKMHCLLQFLFSPEVRMKLESRFSRIKYFRVSDNTEIKIEFKLSNQDLLEINALRGFFLT